VNEIVTRSELWDQLHIKQLLQPPIPTTWLSRGVSSQVIIYFVACLEGMFSSSNRQSVDGCRYLQYEIASRRFVSFSLSHMSPNNYPVDLISLLSFPSRQAPSPPFIIHFSGNVLCSASVAVQEMSRSTLILSHTIMNLNHFFAICIPHVADSSRHSGGCAAISRVKWALPNGPPSDKSCAITIDSYCLPTPSHCYCTSLRQYLVGH